MREVYLKYTQYTSCRNLLEVHPQDTSCEEYFLRDQKLCTLSILLLSIIKV